MYANPSDRELLELAAKAAGIEVGWVDPVWNDPEAVPYIHLPSGKLWNPLTDDGDALLLAKALMMLIEITPSYTEVYCRGFILSELTSGSEQKHGDPMLYVRRAIVRAAAEIDKSMK